MQFSTINNVFEIKKALQFFTLHKNVSEQLLHVFELKICIASQVLRHSEHCPLWQQNTWARPITHE